MLGELIAHSLQDGANGVDPVHLALQGRLDGIPGGRGPVAAVRHRLQHLASVL